METIAKATLTQATDQALTQMRNETNDGFKSGSVSKNELLCWITIEFQRAYFKKSISKIRNDHFDEIADLESRIEAIKAARKIAQGVDPILETAGSDRPQNGSTHGNSA